MVASHGVAFALALLSVAACRNFGLASLLVNTVYTFFELVAGLLIVSTTLPKWLAWIGRVSFLNFAFRALSQNELYHAKFPCVPSLPPAGAPPAAPPPPPSSSSSATSSSLSAVCALSPNSNPPQYFFDGDAALKAAGVHASHLHVGAWSLVIAFFAILFAAAAALRTRPAIVDSIEKWRRGEWCFTKPSGADEDESDDEEAAAGGGAAGGEGRDSFRASPRGSLQSHPPPSPASPHRSALLRQFSGSEAPASAELGLLRGASGSPGRPRANGAALSSSSLLHPPPPPPLQFRSFAPVAVALHDVTLVVRPSGWRAAAARAALLRLGVTPRRERGGGGGGGAGDDSAPLSRSDSGSFAAPSQRLSSSAAAATAAAAARRVVLLDSVSVAFPAGSLSFLMGGASFVYFDGFSYYLYCLY